MLRLVCDLYDNFYDDVFDVNDDDYDYGCSVTLIEAIVYLCFFCSKYDDE